MSSADYISIDLAPSATDEVRDLIGELDRELSAEYSPEQRHGLSLEAIFQPHIRFFLARLDGAAVGCGGVALFADFAEVKRMYVREVARRGAGVARPDRGRGAKSWACPFAARDGRSPGRGFATPCAGRVPTLRGLRRLCHHGATGRRDQRLPRKTTQARVAPVWLKAATYPNSDTDSARNPMPSGKLFGVWQTTAALATLVSPTTFRT